MAHEERLIGVDFMCKYLSFKWVSTHVVSALDAFVMIGVGCGCGWAVEWCGVVCGDHVHVCARAFTHHIMSVYFQVLTLNTLVDHLSISKRICSL